jgi:hypothetical protein
VQELGDLFQSLGLRDICLAGVCPLLRYLPTEQQVAIPDQEHVYVRM